MRRPLRGRPCAAVLCCLIAIASGCGTDDGSRPRSTEAGPWVSLGQSISVESDTPARAARRYVSRVAVSAAPFAMAQQVPEVTAVVGRREMARALENATLALLGARARPVLMSRKGRSAEVAVAISGESLEPKRYRFVLVARAGRWLVAYDTLTRRALAEQAPRRIVRRYLAAGLRVGGSL